MVPTDPTRRPGRRSAGRGRRTARARPLQFARWLLLSALLHAAGFGALFALAPGPAPSPKELGAAVEVLPPQPDAAVAATGAEPLPAPRAEGMLEAAPTPEHEPSVHDRIAVEGDPGYDTPGNTAGREAPFEGPQWNQVVGLGGGAGGKYGGRVEGRSSLVGAARAAGSAIEDGLRWLCQHQDDDGRFDADGFMKHDPPGAPCDGPGNPAQDVGVTGLALLALLGDGNSPRAGASKENVKRAVRWLLSQQQDSGLFGTRAADDYIYGHAIAAYALCEAYGLSEYSILRAPAQRAIDYLVAHRNPQAAWRYEPRQEQSDTSVTGWCMLACESARQFKLQIEPAVLDTGIAFFDRMTDAQGRTGYMRKGQPSSRHAGAHEQQFPPARGEALTAVALFCRLFAGQDPRERPLLGKAAELLLQKPPRWDAGGDAAGGSSLDFYYWFYGSCAMYQMGDRYWSEWSRQLVDAVARHQRTDGSFAGSWDPVDAWGQDGGRVYATATLVLALQAHYRYGRFLAR